MVLMIEVVIHQMVVVATMVVVMVYILEVHGLEVAVVHPIFQGIMDVML